MNHVLYGDLYRIYLSALRDGFNFHLTYIPQSFDMNPNEMFDSNYMKALFELGYDSAKIDQEWRKAPPGYDTK